MVKKPINLTGNSRNYYKPITENDIPQTLKLMRSIPNPKLESLDSRMTVNETKKEAKKAEGIFRKRFNLKKYGNPTEQFSDVQLLWIFDLYELGINKIYSGQHKKERIRHSPIWLGKQISHSFAHMAWIANVLAERNSSDLEQKIAIHKVAYKCYNESLSVPLIHKDVNPFYFAVGRARTSGTISEEYLKGNIKKSYSWNRLCYKDIVRSIKIYDALGMEGGKKYFYLHASLASIAECIASYTEDGINVDVISWLEKASEQNFKSAELSEDIDYTHSALSTVHSARNALRLFLLTGEKSYKKTALARYTKFINMYEDAQELREKVYRGNLEYDDKKNILRMTKHKYGALYKKSFKIVKILRTNQKIEDEDSFFRREIRI